MRDAHQKSRTWRVGSLASRGYESGFDGFFAYALDDLMDGARTGRWCYQHLTKPEQKSLGTGVQVLLTREFGIPDGSSCAWNISGYGSECIFAVDAGAWEIPMEMYRCEEHGDRSGDRDATALVVWMSEDSNEWGEGCSMSPTSGCSGDKTPAGPPVLTRGTTGDASRRSRCLRSTGCGAASKWICRITPSFICVRSGGPGYSMIGNQGSVEWTAVSGSLGDIVRKPTVLTVAQQDDAPKRVRDSRKNLQPEGIVILGHQESHPVVARQLNLPVPEKGEWLAVRLIPVDRTDGRPTVCIDSVHWAVAMLDDSGGPGPVIPKRGPFE